MLEKELLALKLNQEDEAENMNKNAPVAFIHHHRGKRFKLPWSCIYSCIGFYTLFDLPHKINHKSKKPILIKPFPTGASQTLLGKQNTQPNPNNDTTQNDVDKLWFIVRYMTIDGKTNSFRLTGGETIKLGRVKFIVREIQTAEDENKTDFDSLEDVFLNPEESPSIAIMNDIRELEARMPSNRLSIQHFHSFEEEHKIPQLEEEKKESILGNRVHRETRVPKR